MERGVGLVAEGEVRMVGHVLAESHQLALHVGRFVDATPLLVAVQQVAVPAGPTDTPPRRGRGVTGQRSASPKEMRWVGWPWSWGVRTC